LFNEESDFAIKVFYFGRMISSRRSIHFEEKMFIFISKIECSGAKRKLNKSVSNYRKKCLIYQLALVIKICLNDQINESNLFSEVTRICTQ
jgi:hypothetical protein